MIYVQFEKFACIIQTSHSYQLLVLVIVCIQLIGLGCRCHAAQICMYVVGMYIAPRPYCWTLPPPTSVHVLLYGLRVLSKNP